LQFQTLLYDLNFDTKIKIRTLIQNFKLTN